jgi:hypothetical protein
MQAEECGEGRKEGLRKRVSGGDGDAHGRRDCGSAQGLGKREGGL